MTRTFRTLFSGGELFGCGARAAGWQHIDGFEISNEIAAVARLNGFHVHTADVCTVDYTSLSYADHLHASPSCKNASQAKTQVKDENGAPIERETQEDRACGDAVCRAIAAHQGATFSLENVWGYRNFESFARILAALRSAGFVYDFDHINSADFGVPQTRRRLILRAVRGRDWVPTLHPTHREGGDMFSPPWNGWYAAIEVLIPTLPDTQPAAWQLARLPAELHETLFIRDDNACQEWGRGGGRAFLMGNNNQEWGDGVVYEEEPSFSVTTQSHGRSRAYLIGGQYQNPNTSARRVVQHVGAASPSWTVTPGAGKDTRAFLLHDTSTMEIRDQDEPSAVCVSSVGRKAVKPCAYLVGGGNTNKNIVDSKARAADEPTFTITHASVRDRAYAGRWVRMTVQALGRFQTVPDDYRGLTAEINGNGVPSLLARRIMESFG